MKSLIEGDRSPGQSSPYLPQCALTASEVPSVRFWQSWWTCPWVSLSFDDVLGAVVDHSMSGRDELHVNIGTSSW